MRETSDEGVGCSHGLNGPRAAIAPRGLGSFQRIAGHMLGLMSTSTAVHCLLAHRKYIAPSTTESCRVARTDF